VKKRMKKKKRGTNIRKCEKRDKERDKGKKGKRRGGD